MYLLILDNLISALKSGNVILPTFMYPKTCIGGLHMAHWVCSYIWNSVLNINLRCFWYCMLQSNDKFSSIPLLLWEGILEECWM